ncbi:MAG: hypothetical protein COW02_04845 [Comamonadaceae bacterium CG12_big_fil_rev_8_21_14_0_65_59_15]|nr:MAG: hypothetical protein COW02_04845 [Comamonadaceae bacterium CG12_big_fil_rev_8_21_14_0_65_59_15]
MHSVNLLGVLGGGVRMQGGLGTIALLKTGVFSTWLAFQANHRKAAMVECFTSMKIYSVLFFL